MSRRFVFAGLALIAGCTESAPNATRPPPKTVVSASVAHAAPAPDGKLVEFVSGDRTFLGAKAKDFESGKKIATLAAAKDRIRPEVVCGEPASTTRDVPLDESKVRGRSLQAQVLWPEPRCRATSSRVAVSWRRR